MNISTYNTSSNTIKLCGAYNLSGQYIYTDYISKNFTSIPINHYELVVRFGIGFIGTWLGT
jgi:hypothetical protein